jgi:hypothetical protein
VEGRSPRGRNDALAGGEVVEDWELTPDRSRIIVHVKMEGGFGPGLDLKRIYDREAESSTP